MPYTFQATEFGVETFAFTHRGFRVGVHLHPICSNPGELAEHADHDPVLAWIYIAGPAGRLVLNAQYDSMMERPFFLNVPQPGFGASIPGSGSFTMWTTEELTQTIARYLDTR